jgi:hypothetical protein
LADVSAGLPLRVGLRHGDRDRRSRHRRLRGVARPLPLVDPGVSGTLHRQHEQPVGRVEALGIIADSFGLEGRFWTALGALNGNFGGLGFLIIGIFAASWVVSLVIYRVKGYDGMEPTRG